MTCGIYKIENKINGKSYIGQSANIERRWKDHKTHYKINDEPLYNEMKLYGIENFELSVIEECDEENLLDREIFWIDYYNSYNEGYNRTLGGLGLKCCGNKLSKEQASEIKHLLIETNISYKKISEEYNISENMITMINMGKCWDDMKTNYPLRVPIDTVVYKNKNGITYYKRNEHFCIKCGCKIDKDNQSGMCIKCYNESRRNNSKINSRITKEELKKLIREYSFLQIGKMFNVTDSAIRKWCDHYNLPKHSREIKKITDEEWDKL